MSSIILKKVNYAAIVKRLMRLQNFDNEYQVADMLGISPPDMSRRKKSGTLLNLIIDWAINQNINLDWLFKGEGPAKTPQSSVIEKRVDDMEKRLIALENKCDDILLMLEKWGAAVHKNPQQKGEERAV